ncbi:antifreeze protein Maxi-like [Penaeus monodon]|uniref:antifreeze protein Maxi-like n=1 Tax=Penaeus monodon TaxID=6687 RepID=UPI0018A781DD|nr:antifreeze protein Maxi-like [Penaeus monodon]
MVRGCPSVSARTGQADRVVCQWMAVSAPGVVMCSQGHMLLSAAAAAAATATATATTNVAAVASVTNAAATISCITSTASTAIANVTATAAAAATARITATAVAATLPIVAVYTFLAANTASKSSVVGAVAERAVRLSLALSCVFTTS